MKKRVLFLGLVVLFVACGATILSSCSGNNIDSPNMVLSSSWQGYGEAVADTTLFSKCQEIHLEMKQGYVVQKIDKVLRTEDRLFLCDFLNKQILIFGLDGKAIGKIDRQGHGPGEYIKSFDATYDAYSKKIMVLVDPKAVMHFDIDGNYLKTEDADDYYSNVSADKSYVYLYNPTYANAIEPDYTITAISKKTNQRHGILSFGKEYAPFCKMSNKMSNMKDFTLFTRKLDDNIYCLQNGKLVKQYSLDFGEMKFPSNKIDKQYGCMDIYMLCSKNKWVYTIYDVVSTKEKLIFSTNLLGVGVFDTKNKSTNYYKYLLVTHYGALMYKLMYTIVEGVTPGICIVEYPQDLAAIRKSKEKLLNKTTITEEDTNPNGNPTLLLFSN